MAGNQFMVMDDLIKTFHKKHPEVEYIFCGVFNLNTKDTKIFK
jgi:hypothetical protein